MNICSCSSRSGLPDRHQRGRPDGEASHDDGQAHGFQGREGRDKERKGSEEGEEGLSEGLRDELRSDLRQRPGQPQLQAEDFRQPVRPRHPQLRNGNE